MASRICLFPGSFDPMTLGHADIINRAADLFDTIIIGIGTNSSKQSMFSLEQRKEWISAVFAHDSRIQVQEYHGLTVDFCKKIDARFILRGIRSVGDFEYERAISDLNKSLVPGIETVFLTSSARYASVSSTLVRDVIRYGGDARQFLPKEIVY